MNDPLARRLVELTRDLILIPTTENHPGDMDRGMEFIRNHLEEIEGLSLTLHRSHGVPSLLALPWNALSPEVLFLAHLDVVPLPEEVVYKSTLQDGKIYGPGAADMKGPLAILLEVFRDMHLRYPGVSLGLAVTSDEERGGRHGVEYLFKEVGLRCGTAIIPDSGSLNRITVAEKGTLHLAVRCHGPSGHACRPWLVPNPLERLMDRLAEIKAFFSGLAKSAGEGHWYSTFTVTIIRTPNEATNRIPGHAEAICDVRFVPPHTASRILEMLQEKLDSDMKTEILVCAEPSTYAPDPLFLQVTEEITGRAVILYKEHGGSDGRLLAELGIPVIMSRPEVGDVHSEREWVEIESMVSLYRIYEKYLERKFLVGL